MTLSIELFLLIASLLLFFSLVIGKTGYKYGVPTLLLFLIIGCVAGSEGLGLLEFNSPRLAQYIGVIALNVILFSGGMDTRYNEIKPVILPGVLMATVGVFLTALLTGAFIYLITKNIFQAVTLSFVESVLLASIMASTDSASVFSILRSKGLRLKENLRPLLELESGSNDPMAYMLTIVMLQLIHTPEISGWEVMGLLMQQLLLGGLCGVVLGKIAVRIINRIDLDNDALYSVLLFTTMLFLFGFTSFVGGNGYLAVYVGGLFLGNNRFVHKRSSLKFFDGLTWLCQIVMFLSLGLLVNPSELLPVAGIGLLIAFFMIVVARPISVFTCLAPFKKFSTQGKLFASWVGLRGAVPIIFATYPWIEGVPQAKVMFNIVFFITILSLILQGTFLAKLAHWLHLDLPMQQKSKLKEFDVEFSDDIKSAMCEMKVNAKMLEDGNRLMDIALPDHTLVAMVKRSERYFIPRGNTHLEVGDVILLITDDEKAMRETMQSLHVE